jgi:hypothetical protein
MLVAHLPAGGRGGKSAQDQRPQVVDGGGEANRSTLASAGLWKRVVAKKIARPVAAGSQSQTRPV